MYRNLPDGVELCEPWASLDDTGPPPKPAPPPPPPDPTPPKEEEPI